MDIELHLGSPDDAPVLLPWWGGVFATLLFVFFLPFDLRLKERRPVLGNCQHCKFCFSLGGE